MLLSQKTLDGIVSGEIDRVYRRWKRPAVVEGNTAADIARRGRGVGLRQVDESEIQPGAAGYQTAEEVLEDIRPPEPGRYLYEVQIRWAGEDHRIALREASELSGAALQEIDDAVSGIGRRGGPTGIDLLRVIDANPAKLAKELADEIGAERASLKRRIRQLKEIGLTESLRVGYRLSPRGEAYLALKHEQK